MIIVPLILIVVFVTALLLIGEVLGQLKGSEMATVYFKPGLVPGDMREGEVTKKDRYIVVKSDTYGEEFFTWDQIRYISAKDKESSSKRLDRIVDVIEIVSKLGIAASVIVFLIGLYQYDQGQKWKREEFLAAAVKEFTEQSSVRNAMRMLDSLALYTDGREVKLFPDKEKYEDRTVFVSNVEIYNALTITPDNLDNKAKEIRSCFDGLLSYLESFYHYLVQGLITQDALMSHIGYWLIILGPGDDLDCIYKKRIFAYAHEYKFYEIELLIGMYHKKFDWRKLPCSEDEPLVSGTVPSVAPAKSSRLTLSKTLSSLFLGIFGSMVLLGAWFNKKQGRRKRPRR
jgi:hypothetical protein